VIMRLDSDPDPLKTMKGLSSCNIILNDFNLPQAPSVSVSLVKLKKCLSSWPFLDSTCRIHFKLYLQKNKLRK
jgi:hypothetical protein